MFHTSVIVSVYNRFDFLELVLAGLERQTMWDFEVVIADDGSNETFADNLKKITPALPFPLIHVRHEDKGFRKNKILNKAIEAANSDYLIFIDGDCIPHSKFLDEHTRYGSRYVCLTGRRVNLSEKISTQLTPGMVKRGWLEKNTMKLITDGLFGKSDYVEKGFYVKNKTLRGILNDKPRGLLGCNFSINKDDLLHINGFDERYEAPSIGEDSDIQYRLELAGMRIRSLNNIAVQYHLYHPLQERLQQNLDLFNKVKAEAKAFTPYGIKKAQR